MTKQCVALSLYLSKHVTRQERKIKTRILQASLTIRRTVSATVAQHRRTNRLESLRNGVRLDSSCAGDIMAIPVEGARQRCPDHRTKRHQPLSPYVFILTFALTSAHLIRDREHPNLVGYPLQGTSALIDKTEPRARDKIADGARHKHLTTLSLGRDTGSDMNGNSGDVLSLQFDLTSVQATADLQVKGAHPLDDSRRAPNRARRPVECGEKAVPKCLHLPPSQSGNFLAHEVIVLVQ